IPAHFKFEGWLRKNTFNCQMHYGFFVNSPTWQVACIPTGFHHSDRNLKSCAAQKPANLIIKS
ncbi:MAG: hypothetical protein ACK2TU_01885, partial [Anaerolineales bacterium]